MSAHPLVKEHYFFPLSGDENIDLTSLWSVLYRNDTRETEAEKRV